MIDPRLGYLAPSTQPPLTREQIAQLPVGMIVLRRFQEGPWRTYKIAEVARPTRSAICHVWEEAVPAWSRLTEPLGAEGEVRYPRLPRLSVRLTEPQVRDRSKTVSRRLKTPAWCKPGALALIVDRVRAAGAIGLAVVEIVSVRPEPLSSINGGWASSSMVSRSDMEKEGFPEMSRDDFISFFCAAMKVTPDREVARIEWRYL